MTSESTLPTYHRVGGWNLMQWPPFDIEEVSYFNYFIDADLTALQSCCDAFFTEPSGGAVVVKPLISQMIISFADIKKATSSDPAAGSTPEKDLLLWFPVVRLVNGEVTDVLVFSPYIFVDNPVAVSMGREMFGFPKNWGGLESYPEAPDSRLPLTMTTYGLPEGKKVLAPFTILDLQNVGAEGSFEELVDVGAELLKVLRSLMGGNGLSIAQNVEAGEKFLASFLAQKQDFLFLKQFPSMTNTADACYQTIGQMKTTLGPIKKFGLMDFKYQLNYWNDMFHDLSGTFGWGPGPLDVKLAFYMDFSFTIDSAEIVWQADTR